MNNRSDNQKVEVGRERERENGWGRKVQGDDSAWRLYLMRRFHFLKKVSQLIIAPAYISDCCSSVVSTSRQLIKAFLFSLLYTWTSVGSSQEKLPLCCTTVEALLHSAITSTRPSGSISSHVAICSLVWDPLQWLSEFCLFIKIQTVISGTQKGLPKTGTFRDAHSFSHEETRVGLKLGFTFEKRRRRRILCAIGATPLFCVVVLKPLIDNW